MGTSAAVSGLLAAAIPAVVSVLSEGLPGWRRGAGFVVAAVAIWMIAAEDSVEEERSTLWLAIGAGAGFGFYFVALKYAGAGGLLWPMTTARVGSITACTMFLFAVAKSSKVRIARPVMLWVLSTALLDTSGNIMFLAATRAGRLDVAAVLAALYPASTILLAAFLLKERPTRRQGLGMGVAVAAVVLITL